MELHPPLPLSSGKTRPSNLLRIGDCSSMHSASTTPPSLKQQSLPHSTSSILPGCQQQTSTSFPPSHCQCPSIHSSLNTTCVAIPMLCPTSMLQQRVKGQHRAAAHPSVSVSRGLWSPVVWSGIACVSAINGALQYLLVCLMTCCRCLVEGSPTLLRPLCVMSPLPSSLSPTLLLPCQAPLSCTHASLDTAEALQR